MLTAKGVEKVLCIKTKIEGRKKRKDRKWQMIIFDIPEKIRGRRDCFRDGLKRLGYERLQQSIWICPYDVFKETKELIKYFKLEPFVKLLLTEEINIG
jgi:phenylacetic acid degradation operon negative regulatory protein